ncbi:DUF4190 domain-containing protein [Streptomyces leeuwenhoekii]|jgi:hypothetical protein|uniref:DUF4190 domain-containing protein n=1 Tax=Streptomyces leeuwenhoekii TaxID=1437453 RepID=UPI0036CCF0C3
MSDARPGPEGFGPPPSQPPQPAGGYAYPQSAPGYGYPGPNQAQGRPVAPPACPQAPGYALPARPGNGLGTTGLVLGIIGVVCTLSFFLWFFGVILGILGIVFGAIGRGKANRGEATNKGAATAGLVCGIVATVIIPLLGFLLFASVMSSV